MTVEFRVNKEQDAQNEKWGIQDHSLTEWIAIIGEEFGEASQAVVDFHFDPKYKKGDMTLESLARTRAINHVKAELIQLAAVAIQAVKSIERQTLDVTR